MEQRLQFCIFSILIQVSLAVWQRVTVMEGDTVDLTCPITNAHHISVEWKNPGGYIMFFKHKKVAVIAGVKDKRYSVNKFSESEFTVSISDVTFKDGGNYTCSHYDDLITDKTVELTVLGKPKMTKAKHAGRYDIKCTAEGNNYPPQIFWRFNNGPEIHAHSQVLHEDKKYASKAMLSVQSVENRVTVKCIVRHPALHSQPLMDFIKIGQISAKSHPTTTIHLPTAQPKGSTEVLRITTSGSRHGRTVYLTTRDMNGPSSEGSIKLSTFPYNQPKTVTESTRFPLNHVTPTGSHLSTSANSRTSALSGSTREKNDTLSNATSTTSWKPVSETTEEIISYNQTERNGTGSFNNLTTENKGRSLLLIFLVTCLIFGLLVVVIFFAIKLRRAHIAWKRKNEDSDPSEESNKSKSSQEERNSQGQRRRGLCNTAFTQYVSEEPPVITSVINTAALAATERANKEQTSHLQNKQQTSAKCDIKETEL